MSLSTLLGFGLGLALGGLVALVQFMNQRRNRIAYSKEEQTCLLCKSAMTGGQELDCGHQFHVVCLATVLSGCTPPCQVCPQCRVPIFRRMKSLQETAASEELILS